MLFPHEQHTIRFFDPAATWLRPPGASESRSEEDFGARGGTAAAMWALWIFDDP